MKKTMKRYLSFLLAIMMIVTSVAFSASAAAVCDHVTATGDPTYYKEITPTCETDGYKIFYCTKCSNPSKGYMVEVNRGDYTKSYGHVWGEDFYEPNDNGAYRKYNLCTRTGCDAKAIELQDGKEVVYYLVSFYNNRVTASYDETIPYTKVAATYKDPVLLYSTYVKEGTEAVYENKDTPVRGKTKSFAAYTFVGWTEDSELEASRQENLSGYKCADLSKINGNKSYYPVFVGETHNAGGVITHDVVVYTVNKEGTVVPGTVKQEIIHGGSPKYSHEGVLYDEPVMPEDLVNTYTFNGWSTKHNDNSGVPGIPRESKIENGNVILGIENYPVYGNVNFYPTFIANPKDYTLEFYKDVTDSNGEYNTLIEYTYGFDANGELDKRTASFDGVNLERDVISANEGIARLNTDKAAMNKASDDDYIYVWTGKWAVLSAENKVGRTVDLRYLKVYASEIIEEDGKKIIRLVPVYERVKQLYAVDIYMSIPQGEDSDYYRGEADVHVVANNGQLVASGKTNENGVFRCYLYNQRPFTVTVATQDEKYLGNATINFLQKVDANTDTEAYVNRCNVEMQLNPDYETHCTCIHHNALLQPIWVRVLNILHTLFGVKYVCCYDMYSTIGSLLIYTA